MKKYIRLISLTLLQAPLVAFAQMGPHYPVLQANPAPSNPTLNNLQQVGSASGLQQSDIKVVIASMVQILLGFVGLVFLILIIWSGVQWMLSGGNEKKLEDAKKRIVSATIGLVLVVTAYSIAYTINKWLATAVSNGATGPSQNGGQ